MKKQTIWILTILMAVTFMGLLFMQIFYMRSMVQMRYDQFAQAARQSLLAVSVRLSHDETQHFLREDLDNVESKTIYGQYIGEPTPRLGGVRYSFTTSSGLEADVTIKGSPVRDLKPADNFAPAWTENQHRSGVAAHERAVHETEEHPR